MMRFAPLRRIAMLAVVLALVACGDAKTDERDTAAGKILPGSISDAMLQTDRLQSEAPLVAPKIADGAEKAGAPGVKPAAAADEADASEGPVAEAAAPAAAPAPVAAPTPQPAP